MGLAGVVLAAGASERMGRPKALLDFRGRAFVVRILEALEALDVKSRVVVLGPDAARVRPSLATHDCVIVENPDLTSHAIGSLRAALAALEPIRPSGIVAWPVDLPHVRLTTLERLLEAHRRAWLTIPSNSCRIRFRHGHISATCDAQRTSGAPMSSGIEAQVLQPYKYGFVTDIESETVPPGLSEDVIRLISQKKGEPPWMLEWRLRAYRNWLK